MLISTKLQISYDAYFQTYYTMSYFYNKNARHLKQIRKKQNL